jgi:hypothetical protein
MAKDRGMCKSRVYSMISAVGTRGLGSCLNDKAKPAGYWRNLSEWWEGLDPPCFNYRRENFHLFLCNWYPALRLIGVVGMELCCFKRLKNHQGLKKIFLFPTSHLSTYLMRS